MREHAPLFPFLFSSYRRTRVLFSPALGSASFLPSSPQATKKPASLPWSRVSAIAKEALPPLSFVCFVACLQARVERSAFKFASCETVERQKGSPPFFPFLWAYRRRIDLSLSSSPSSFPDLAYSVASERRPKRPPSLFLPSSNR